MFFDINLMNVAWTTGNKYYQKINWLYTYIYGNQWPPLWAPLVVSEALKYVCFSFRDVHTHYFGWLYKVQIWLKNEKSWNICQYIQMLKINKLKIQHQKSLLLINYLSELHLTLRQKTRGGTEPYLTNSGQLVKGWCRMLLPMNLYCLT